MIWPSASDQSPGTEFKYVFECKVLRVVQRPRNLIERGAVHTAAYMDRCRPESGHLVMFDRRESRTWEERIFEREGRARGWPVTIWGV